MTTLPDFNAPLALKNSGPNSNPSDAGYGIPAGSATGSAALLRWKMKWSEDRIYIEYMALSKLQRAPRNPKAHDLGLLERSMIRFGCAEPPAINETTSRVVAGHGRLDTLERMKAAGEEPPGRIRVENGEWYVPVRGIRFDSDAE